MLKTITLENFTVFPKAKIEFSPGLNVFVGENGTGKTHLLKLGFALLNAIRRAEGGEPFGALLDSELNWSFDGVVSDLSSFDRGKITVAATTWAGDDVAFFASDGVTTAIRETIVVPTQPKSIFIYPVAVPLKLPDADRGLPWTSRTLEPIRPLLDDLQKVANPWLAADSARKLTVLANHLKSGRLTIGATLFWDTPETGLNAKWLVPLAETLVRLSEHVQVCIATHSLFLLRELDILQKKEQFAVSSKYFNLLRTDSSVAVRHGKACDHIGDIVSLDMEIDQSNRYLNI